jgi:hypothetical protein
MRCALLCVLIVAQVSSACPQVEDIISSESRPLPPSAANGITKEMTVTEILNRLGPAARDVGSGLHVLQWDLTDGRVFFVSTPDACGKPMGLGYVERAPNKTIEPTR